MGVDRRGYVSTMSSPLCIVFLMLLMLGSTAPLWAQEGKLVPDNARSGDEFGTSVAIDGDVALIGARFDDDAGSDAGSAYLFVRNGTAWNELLALNPGHGEGDRLGISVALDGDYAVVGATGDDAGADNAGAAYVFVRDGQQWTLQAKLMADDPQDTHRFGVSVAISGDYILVGASGDDDQREGSGAAYVFVRNGSTWTRQTKLKAGDAVNGDAFGNAVALDGTVAVIGAVGDNFPSGISGSAYVFVREGNTWNEVDKIFAAEGAPENFFGNAVAVDGEHVIVGMSFDDDEGDNAGSAYVFSRVGGDWLQRVKLIASDIAPGDELGQAVAINESYAIVTAPGQDGGGEDAGAAYLYAYHPTSDRWGEQCETVASRTTCTETLKLIPAQIGIGAEFGFSVAVSGPSAIVGARLDGGLGAAYVYALDFPAAPMLQVPLNQAAGLEPDVELRWNAVAGASFYRVQVATTPDFVNPVVNATNVVQPRFQVNNLAHSTTYYWRVAATNAFGTGGWSSVWHFSIASGTAVESRGEEIPDAFLLHQNYPNPFNPETAIHFDLPVASHVSLAVYDVTGTAVATLVDEPLGAGRYTTSWEADGVASGVYLLRMRAGTVVQTQTMVVLR